MPQDIEAIPVYERRILINGDEVGTVLTTQVVTDAGVPREPIGYLVPSKELQTQLEGETHGR